jgi:hypothetical protein
MFEIDVGSIKLPHSGGFVVQAPQSDLWRLMCNQLPRLARNGRLGRKRQNDRSPEPNNNILFITQSDRCIEIAIRLAGLHQSIRFLTIRNWAQSLELSYLLRFYRVPYPLDPSWQSETLRIPSLLHGENEQHSNTLVAMPG